MRIDILTLFPQMFAPVLQESMLRIAQEKNLVEFHVHDLRPFGEGQRKSVDDRPFGGGPGMVLMCAPVYRAVAEAERLAGGPAHRVVTSPQGRPLTHEVAARLAREPRVAIICGHYEGYDERIVAGLEAEEISIGDYVLTGGELAALVIADAVSRLVPGVLGAAESSARDCFANAMLSYPQYTRPREFCGMAVPEVLVSGDHGRIAAWRAAQARQRTAERRPELFMRRVGEAKVGMPRNNGPKENAVHNKNEAKPSTTGPITQE
jgi:tRNA (guanine37-N1)-methyltransferase